MESPTAILDKKSQTPIIDEEIRKTLNLVLVIILFLFLVIPTSVGFIFEHSGTGYVLDHTYFANPINCIGVLLESIMGYQGSSIFWVFVTPLYYILTFGIIGEFGVTSRKVLSSIFFIIWASLPIFLFASFSIINNYNSGLEWILISLPYYLLLVVSVMKIGQYLKDEIRLRSLLVWILIPIIILIPGGLLLNSISALEMAAFRHTVVVWTPLPIATIIIIVVLRPLKSWIRDMRLNHEVESELDGMLHPDDVINDI